MMKNVGNNTGTTIVRAPGAFLIREAVLIQELILIKETILIRGAILIG